MAAGVHKLWALAKAKTSPHPVGPQDPAHLRRFLIAKLIVLLIFFPPDVILAFVVRNRNFTSTVVIGGLLTLATWISLLLLRSRLGAAVFLTAGSLLFAVVGNAFFAPFVLGFVLVPLEPVAIAVLYLRGWRLYA